MDHELELGLFVGPGNPPGKPIAIEDAEAQAFGLCLLDDWSARDPQCRHGNTSRSGRFSRRIFVTTISPWIVTMEALVPYRAPFARPGGVPRSLPYLDTEGKPRCRRDRDRTRSVDRDRGDACRPRGCRDRVPSKTPTGPSRSWSPTTPSTAAICSPAISSARARSRAGAGPGRLAAGAHARRQSETAARPTAKSAIFCRTATRSSCEAAARGRGAVHIGRGKVRGTLLSARAPV